MKKVLGLLLIFLSAFLLIACEGFEIVQITNITLDTSTTTDTTEDSTEITTEIDSQTNVTDTSDTSLTTSTIDDYTIIFETNGGNNIAPFVFIIGDEIQLPIPEKEGYTFLGWALDNETASEIINETYEFNGSITLYAKWQINTYLLQFLDFDGNVLETIAIEYHASLTEVNEPIPSKEAYSFIGWDMTLPDIMPAENIICQSEWEINQYTITFNSDEGTDVTAITQDYNTDVMEPTDPTKNGYTFVGWYSDSELTTAYVFSTMPAEDITLYAKWNVNSYTLQFINDDGTVLFTADYDYNADISDISVDDPTKTGHTFSTWDVECPDTMPANNVTITATYTINQYTITFSSDGGTDVTAITQDYDTVVLEPTDPTKDGYTFEGWYSDSELSNEYIFTTIPTEDITVYAKWTINQYTITFNSDGGTDVTAITQDYNTDVTEPAEPTKEGYTFGGWYSDSEFSVAFVFETMPAKDITLYAKWNINAYTLQFIDDDGTVLFTDDYDYNSDLSDISVDHPTKTGYTFSAWDVECPDIMPANNVTITATYTINQYIITFSSDGGTDVNAIEQDYDTDVTEPTEPTKEGYTFDGWYSDSELATAYVFSTMPAEDITLYAKWNVNSYTLQFIDDDGTVLFTDDYDYNSDLSDISVDHPTKTGYTFSTWDVECPETMPANNVTITATYTINQYTITFSSDGGTDVTAITQDYDTVVLEPTEPTKEGYTFDGWYSDTEFTSEYVFNRVPAEDITLYAKWTINQYTITFDTDGGNDIGAILQDYNTDVIEPAEPTKEGYTFGGWYSDSEFSVAFIFEMMPAKDNTLYAKWNINSYTLQFIDDDGTVLFTDNYDYNSDLSDISVDDPTKTGYTFTAWDVECPDTMPANNVTITATYTINQYTITFSSDGGTDVTAITQDYDTDVTESTEPTKEGYTFDGWYSDSELATAYIFSTMPAEDITLYAKWNINSYTLQFIDDDGTVLFTDDYDYNSDLSDISIDHPTKPGYTFSTWDVECPDIMPANNVTITATYTINQYTITFYDDNQVTILATYTQDYGTEFPTPDIPTNEGFIFGGYYTECFAQGTVIYDALMNIQDDQLLIEDVDLYVHWALTLSGNSTDGYYIYMGEYPTSLYVGTPENLSGVDPITGYVTDGEGIRYKLYNGNYYIVEPIKWMVLTQDYVDGQLEMLLISDMVIDIRRYDDDSNLWESSEVRTFLNGPTDLLLSPFGSIAFNPYEMEQILQTTITVSDTADTVTDYLFLLSNTETLALDALDTNAEKAALMSAYADAKSWVPNAYGSWWLRDDSFDGESRVEAFILDTILPVSVSTGYIGLRPSMMISIEYDQTYEVIFDGNGGTIVSGEENQIIHHGDMAIAPVYGRMGYTLVGWDMSVDPILNNCTITAIYEINQYTITFDSNGGTDVDVMTQDYLSSVTAPTEPTKEGYTFAGWFSDSDLTTLYTFDIMPLGDMTLYAKWNINSYTLQYIDDDGTMLYSSDFDYGSDLTGIEVSDPIKEAYTFSGWDTVLPDTMPAVSVTIQATYTINEYTITFESNGGTDVGAITQDYNSSVTAPTDPSKEGYTFAGWYSDSDLTISYTFDTMPAEDITLYAKWNVNAYTLQYIDDDGTVLYTSDYDYGADLSGIEEPTPIKVGYTFTAWDIECPSTMPAENITIQTTYTINQYTISFDSNGGTVVASITQDYLSAVTEPTESTKEGYIFGGWYSDSDLTISYTFDTIPAEDITLYAKWNVNAYTLQYIDDDGTVLYTSDYDYGADLSGIEEPTPIKVGYTFTAWDIECPSTMPAENITIQATYTINQYTINFDSNGGTVISAITQDYLSTITKPDDPVKDNYTFNGWYSDSELSTVFIFSTMPAGDITLYAKWDTMTYDITYHLDGGANGNNPETYTIETTTIILAEPLKDGYSFAGWFDNADYTGETITDIEIGTTGNIALYAKWMINQYTIDYVIIEDVDYTDYQVLLYPGETVVSVSLGYSHSSAITSEGRVFTWGNNNHGQLGDGTTINSTIPIDITSQFSLNTGEVIVSISLGSAHSIALTSEGRVFTWGTNGYGQLGDGTTTNSTVPIDITSQFNLNEGETIVSISLGSLYSAVISSEGRVFTWGYNYFGQLGNGTTTNSTVPIDITSQFNLNEGETIISISLGGNHSSAISSEGRTFTWGYNGSGQLGNRTTIDNSSPIDITSQFNLNEGETLVSISLGDYHSSVISSEGRVFTWGNNNFGQLGNGTTTNSSIPNDITSQFSLNTGETIVSISLGNNHSSAISSEGRVFTWGRNNFGQLGNGTTTNSTVPIEVISQFDLNEGETIVIILTGNYYSSALTSGGRVFTWGYNAYGQLGDGTCIDRNKPIRITFVDYNGDKFYPDLNVFLNPNETITSISSGQFNSSAITSEGRVFTWGYNNYGQLGDGTTTNRYIPIEITSQFDLNEEETIVSISLGYAHSSAISSEGRVFTWGRNHYGELGDGTITSRYTPTEITSNFGLNIGETITSISLGGAYSIALTSENRVFTWGGNWFAQLGNGTTTNSSTPIDITSQFDLNAGEKIDSISLSSGGAHSIALTSEDRVFTWGYNYSGQLGDGTTITRTTPIDTTSQFDLSEGETIVSISLGNDHSSAISSEGRIFTWGRNNYGQLGDGTTTNSSIPIDITSQFSLNAGETIVSMLSGEYHKSILTSNGRVLTWGENNVGQLGNGTTTNSSIPIDITSQFDLSEGETIISISLGGSHSSAITSEAQVFTWGVNGFGQLGNGITSSSLVPIKISFLMTEIISSDVLTYLEIIEVYSLTRYEYTFNGWFIDLELSTLFNDATMPAGNLTLYGYWTANQYLMTYYLNGGTNSIDNQNSYTVADEFSFIDPIREGYSFLGWYDNPDFSGDPVTGIQLGSTGEISLYAKWTINQYTMSFESNGGTVISAITEDYMTSIIIPTDPIKDECTFGGWYIDSDLLTKYVFDTMPAEDITLYAKWYLAEYTVEYLIIADGNFAELISILNPGETIVSVSLGYYHSSAITSKGRVFTWGQNNYGQLGDGTTTNSTIPIDISSQFSLNIGETIVSISLGNEHSSVLTSEGRVFTWGNNTNGQLGNGPTSYSSTPIDITNQFNLNEGETIVSISLGGNHSSAISSEGRVFTWGGNYEGQLGNGTTTYSSTPIDITNQFNLDEEETIVNISLGNHHSSAISTKGKVFTWGYNYSGQLGDGTATNSTVPIDITSQFSLNIGETIVSITLGGHSSVLTSEGRVFIWGPNYSGQLGDGTTTNSLVPIDITSQFSLNTGEIIVSISLGSLHSSAISSKGRIFTWGYNYYGLLGNGTTTDSSTPIDITNQFNLNEGEIIVSILLGGNHSSAISSEGRVFTWGSNDYGQLGIGTTINHNIPVLSSFVDSELVYSIIMPYLSIVEDHIMTKADYTFNGWYLDQTLETLIDGTTIVDRNITLYGYWTLTDYEITYYLNDGVNSINNPSTYTVEDYVILSEPSKEGYVFNGWYDNSEFLGDPIIDMSLGSSGAFSLYAKWTIGDYTVEYVIIEDIIQTDIGVTLHPGETIINILLGGSHSSALTSEGRVFTWGYNAYGQLGDGTTTSSSIPIDITRQFNLNEGETIISISLGSDHSSALTSNGRMFTWGSNSYGKLGEGQSTNNRYIPTDITSQFNLNAGETIVSISLGSSHSSALTSEGRVFTWGYNNRGQLGNETTMNIYIPTDITSQFNLNAGETIVSISLGNEHSSALTSEGRVFTWGRNYEGELGNGTTTNSTTPIDITSQFNLNEGERIISISLGGYHSSAVTSEGRVFTWGYNNRGQLGNGTTINSTTPIYITSQFNLNEGETIVSTSLGNEYSSVLTSECRVFTWGYNNLGQLGNRTTTSSSIPIDITSHFNFNEGEIIVSVSIGGNHSSVLTSEGRVFTWGYNFYGQLADGTFFNRYKPVKTAFIINNEKFYLDINVFLNPDETIVSISLGRYHSVAITSEGRIFSWGSGTTSSSIPIDITRQFNLNEGETIISISLGSDHSSALTSEGRVFTWGYNYFGQLGNGTTTSSSIPIDITSQFNLNEGETFVSISIGGNHSSALTSEGRVFTWGYNAYGQLGDGTTTNSSIPIDITSQFNLNEGETIVSISLGDEYSLVVTSEGRVFAWGRNYEGQLGDGTTTNSSIPIDITSQFNLNEGETIVSISLGANHSSTLTSEGRVFTWGNNYFGQLGNGTTTSSSIPIDITSQFNLNEGERIVSISLGGSHSSAISSEGRVFTWGNNDYGQLGDGTQAGSTIPIDITSQFDLNAGETIVSIVLGAEYSSVLTSKGRVFMWGYNNYGQLGNGTTTNALEPVRTRLLLVELVYSSLNEYLSQIEDYVLTRTNYSFNGWYIDRSLSQLLNDETMPGNDLVLYGYWTLVEYDIIYNLNDGLNSLDNPSTYTVIDNIILNQPTKEGYTFIGWYDNDSFSGSPITEIILGSFGVMTLYAQWMINEYTISYGEIPNDASINCIVLHSGEEIISVELGSSFTLALTSEGRVFAWGNNELGQLGDGTTIDKYMPIEITSQFKLNIGEKVTSIYSYGGHSSAISSHNRVFTWGGNNRGQLGDGTTTNSSIPIDITNQFNLNGEETIISIALGGAHSSALTSEGRIFTWGYNAWGQLGDGTETSSSIPIDITSQFNLNEGETIYSIALGGSHSAALSSKGRVFTWGDDHYGQLGYYYKYVVYYEYYTYTYEHNPYPREITNNFYLNEGEIIVSISLGSDHSIAFSSEGRVFTWGINGYGQLGIGTSDWNEHYYPIDITYQFNLNTEDGETIKSVGAGSSHSSLMTSEGRVFIWGINSEGQLGMGTVWMVSNPTDMTSYFDLENNEMIILMSIGYRHSSVITSMSRIFIWGRNDEGQIGDNTFVDKDVPIEIETVYFDNITTETYIYGETIIVYSPTSENGVLDGWYTNASLTDLYDFSTMGANNILLYGRWQTGVYPITYHLNNGINALENPDTYSGDETMILSQPTREGYDFLGWYDNADFTGDLITEITQGSTGDVTLYAKWILISYILRYVDYDGTVLQTENFDYGSDLSGVTQPTDPIRTGYTFTGWDISLPETMQANDVTLTAIYEAIQFTVTFLDDEGNTLKTELVDYEQAATAPTPPEKSGYVFDGWDIAFNNVTDNLVVSATYVLDGYTLNLVTFEQGEENVIKISSGAFGTVVLTDQNRIYAGGRNDFGVLGANYGSVDELVDITYVLNLEAGETIIDIVAGLDHIVVITSNDRVLTWGRNDKGQLGDGTFTSKSYAVDITANFGFHENETVLMMDSYYYTILVTSEGRVFAWGQNDWGQIGNGIKTHVNLPVDITSRFGLDAGDNIVFVAGGYWSSAAISADGRVFTWGMNNHNQLANGTTSGSTVPGEITSYFNLDTGDKIIAITIGGLHGGAISVNGKVFTWGDNSYLVGDGNTISSTPYDITDNFNFDSGNLPIYILGRWDSMHLLTGNGDVYGWGLNSAGMVGDGTTTAANYPVNITNRLMLDETDQIIQLHVSGGHVVVLSTQGSVMTWGYNNVGQLGIGSSNATLDIQEPLIPFENGYYNVETTILLYEDDIQTPTRDGYVFDGFYYDQDYTNAFTGTTMPDGDLSLYIKWITE